MPTAHPGPTPASSAAARAARLAAVRALPAQARAAVAGLTPAQLDTPYRAGGWTVRQVIHHIADAHMNALIRMKLVLAEEHPTLKPWDQDTWARLADSAQAPVEESLATLDGVHARMARVLEAAPPEAWSRGAFHPEAGELTLERLVETYGGHGAHHVEQILALRRARGW
ncbi:MAG TPA: putative metal-dependent hydrolase [Planctomycetota bacterium]|nr:putative metal-dependent hydrolase [Planctomycetota bacterium]